MDTSPARPFSSSSSSSEIRCSIRLDVRNVLSPPRREDVQLRCLDGKCNLSLPLSLDLSHFHSHLRATQS